MSRPQGSRGEQREPRALALGALLVLLLPLACQRPARAPQLATGALPAPPALRAEPLPIIVEHAPRAVPSDAASSGDASAAPGPTSRASAGVDAIFVAALSPSEPAPSSDLAVLSAPPPSDGTEPCRASAFQLDAVMRACEQGGTRAAKDLMLRAMSKARARGVELSCASCHVNQTDYSISPAAVAGLRRWL